ncbi:MAG TPA: NAD(P)H-quinone oxidoreductase, partial [Rhodobacter sp.]|nr:NAD(P)H-quinone oxidoreductase [Rhodobacter sp.]
MQQHPKTMRTVGVHTPGGPDALEIINVPVPVPTGRDLLIKVHAAGVNGADLREREGKYPVPPGAPDIMGLEVSGEIVAVG